MGLFISAAGMLIYTPWTWRPDRRNGDSKQDTESSLRLPSLRARSILEAWMASSMRSMRNRDTNDGDSKRTRESDHARPFKIKQFISAAMTDSSMPWTLRVDKRNGELRQAARSSHRRLSLMALRTSVALMAIFTQSMWGRERESGGSTRHLVG